jgi:hypothetical protein
LSSIAIGFVVSPIQVLLSAIDACEHECGCEDFKRAAHGKTLVTTADDPTIRLKINDGSPQPKYTSAIESRGHDSASMSPNNMKDTAPRGRIPRIFVIFCHGLSIVRS